MNIEDPKKFKEVLENLQLVDLLLVRGGFQRNLSFTQTNESELKVEFKIEQNVEKSDPKYIQELVIEFKPSYKFSVLLNANLAIELSYEYLLKFQIKDKQLVKEGLENQEIWDFFTKKQLPRITWGFLREEVHSAMNKCGLGSVPLPLLI